VLPARTHRSAAIDRAQNTGVEDAAAPASELSALVRKRDAVRYRA
jgi:hypothetical protein